MVSSADVRGMSTDGYRDNDRTHNQINHSGLRLVSDSTSEVGNVIPIDSSRASGFDTEALVEGVELKHACVARCLALGYVPLQFLRWHPDLVSDAIAIGMPVHLRFIKRTIDLLCALVLGILVLPFLPFIIFAIKRDSPGPALYSHMRLGQGGRSFRIYKFRSMRTDAEANGAQFAKNNDDRVTRFGYFMRRTRIDEIPQIWNVLKGDMSFIGPRPERPEHMATIETEIPEFSMRLAVKPGLTGWAQTAYCYAGTIDELRRKLEYDLYYIRFASIRLEIMILLRTVKVVLGFKGQ